jgi:peptidyl-prolyl cis-trans isomerase A (cyclophilin A)
MTDIVVMETNKGTIEIELNRGRAPITVKNFVQYVNDEFFNGICFHRIIKRFMVQGGGFTPEGEQRATRGNIQIESQNGLKNEKGTIAMARTSDPDSASSQFFINTVNNANLNYPSFDGHGYTVFGKVTSGMEVVEEIENSATATKMTPYGPMQDWPTVDVVIVKATMK